MTRWIDITTGNPVFRIRDSRVVEINGGDPVFRIRE
jgi:hypothetical protein